MQAEEQAKKKLETKTRKLDDRGRCEAAHEGDEGETKGQAEAEEVSVDGCSEYVEYLNSALALELHPPFSPCRVKVGRLLRSAG